MIEAISPITAIEQTALNSAADFPYLKPEKRRTLVENLKRQANAGIINQEEPQELSGPELVQFLNK